jgi:dTDP-4-dehydrorhamnose 3,5-epimerase
MSEPTDPPAPGPGTRAGVALPEDVRRALSFQSYEPKPAIRGVWTRRLRRHHGSNGWFAEVFRLADGRVATEGEETMELRQLSLSQAEPGRINAFHIHPKVPQDEVWTVVQGKLQVWLVDCRAGSPSEGVRQQVVLSGEDPALLFIPAGVAHGYRAGPAGGLLLYAMNQQFDPADPNEGRLPWDHFGAELWADDRG